MTKANKSLLSAKDYRNILIVSLISTLISLAVHLYIATSGSIIGALLISTVLPAVPAMILLKYWGIQRFIIIPLFATVAVPILHFFVKMILPITVGYWLVILTLFLASYAYGFYLFRKESKPNHQTIQPWYRLDLMRTTVLVFAILITGGIVGSLLNPTGWSAWSAALVYPFILIIAGWPAALAFLFLMAIIRANVSSETDKNILRWFWLIAATILSIYTAMLIDQHGDEEFTG